jgi:hypothetical protein
MFLIWLHREEHSGRLDQLSQLLVNIRDSYYFCSPIALTFRDCFKSSRPLSSSGRTAAAVIRRHQSNSVTRLANHSFTMHSALLLAIAALPFLGADAALKCSTTARCGIQSGNKLTCKNSEFGNCCSKSGYCGSSSAYCGAGCQAGFGDCKLSTPASVKSSSTSTKLPSTLSTKVTVVSVATNSATPQLSTVSAASTLSIVTPSPITVPSSSSNSEVEVSTDAISSSTPFSSASAASSTSIQDVQVTKDAVSSTTPSSAPVTSSTSAPALKVSTDGSCGGIQGFTCPGSAFGNCCSEYGWCGSTSVYCGAGCNTAFGTCNGVSSSVQPSSSAIPGPASSTVAPSSFTTLTRTSSATPAPTQVVSSDGVCGANSFTCLGSAFGDCCSQYGYW